MSDNYKNDNMPRDAQFLRLLMSSREKVYAYILSHVHNSNDAEDIMQDAITVMWRKYDSFEPGTSFTAWAFTISRMYILKYYEKHRHSKLRFSPDLEKELGQITADKLDTEKEDMVDILKGCLEKLDNDSFEIIKKKYIEKNTVREIAVDRGVRAHTMYRIMGKLHKLLHDCIDATVSGRRTV